MSVILSIDAPGGLQPVTTPDGYTIPVDIIKAYYTSAFALMTDAEQEALPHVIPTSELQWDSMLLDHKVTNDPQWYDAIATLQDDPRTNLFNEFGNYCNCHVMQSHLVNDSDMSILDGVVYHPTYADPHNIDYLIDSAVYQVHLQQVTTLKPNYNALCSNFGWLLEDIIKRNFEAMTQYTHIPMSTTLCKHYKLPNPALNVHCHDEPVTTNTVYSDTPAIDSGVTAAQMSIGVKSMVGNAYGMKSNNQFVNTFEDNICQWGAPTKLISDCTKVEISNKVNDTLRTLCIGNWQSKPHQQHQNPAEHHFQTIKCIADTIMDCTSSPAYTWLLAILYVCFLLNHTVCAAINYTVPMAIATGSTVNISPLLHFQWWEPIYYKLNDSNYPSDTREKKGCFVGMLKTLVTP